MCVFVPRLEVHTNDKHYLFPAFDSALFCGSLFSRFNSPQATLLPRGCA
jgi:hypothetical protein